MARPVPSRVHPRFHSLLALVGVMAVAAACGSSATPTASGPATVQPSLTAMPATPAASDGATPSGGATEPAATTTAPGSATPLPAVKVTLPLVTRGLPHAVAISNAGDGRLFVVDQAGRILIVDGGKVAGVFLDIKGRVLYGGERGLLGLAFHPQYSSNGRFFVRYNTANGDLRVSEFHVGSDPSRADPASEKVLLVIPHRQFSNHNGGVIHFGPDGYLYIGTGDGGGGGDPSGSGQNLATLSGKMLRIDVDHTTGSLLYGIPSDNPFVGQAGKRTEIWAYGLRNPYSFSFDRQTGDLWLSDVGQNKYEEVNLATRAGGLGRGANYGWSVMEADHCYKPATGCNTSGKVKPFAEYAHGSNDSIGCSVIGGSVYRGSAYPELAGRYFFGDYCTGRIWTLDAAGPSSQKPVQVLDTSIMITGWGEGSDGEIYLVNSTGNLYHLV